MQMLAWHAANIMNVHLKRPVTVKKLLGKGSMTQVEREEKFKQLMKLLEERRKK